MKSRNQETKTSRKQSTNKPRIMFVHSLVFYMFSFWFLCPSFDVLFIVSTLFSILSLFHQLMIWGRLGFGWLIFRVWVVVFSGRWGMLARAFWVGWFGMGGCVYNWSCGKLHFLQCCSRFFLFTTAVGFLATQLAL